MSLSMLGMVDGTFESTTVTITPPSGDYADGSWVDDGNAVSTDHLATKQNVSSEELKLLQAGGERYTDVQNFYINDGSVHQVGSLLITAEGEKYTIIAADCRPTRFYGKLTGASVDE